MEEAEDHSEEKKIWGGGNWAFSFSSGSNDCLLKPATQHDSIHTQHIPTLLRVSSSLDQL